MALKYVLFLRNSVGPGIPVDKWITIDGVGDYLREKQGATICRRPILAKHPVWMRSQRLEEHMSWPLLSPVPEVIASYDALPAGTNIRVTKVFAKLYRLIHWAMSVTEIGGLRVTKMNPEAFSRATYGGSLMSSLAMTIVCCILTTQSHGRSSQHHRRLRLQVS